MAKSISSAVYALDLAGFGASEKPPNLTYSPHLWYQQVADFAREVVKEPCVLVGNSIGSQASVAFPPVRPLWKKCLVRGVVQKYKTCLFCPATGGHVRGVRAARPREGRLPAQLRGRHEPAGPLQGQPAGVPLHFLE